MNPPINIKDTQFYKFCAYGFLKNLRFFDIFFLLILIDQGFRFTTLGVLYASRELTIYIFELPAGLFADSYGRKNSLIISLVLYILSFGIFYYSFDFFHYQLAMVVFGVAEAFRSGTHKGIILSYLEKHELLPYKVWYYGRTRSWSQWGSFVSTLLALFLMMYVSDYRLAFLFAIAPYLINLLNIYSYPQDNKNDIELRAHTKTISSIQSLFRDLSKASVLRVLNSSALHSSFLKVVKDYIQYLIVILLSSSLYHYSESTAVCFVYLVIFSLTAFASRFSHFMERYNSDLMAGTTLIIGIGILFFIGINIYFENFKMALLAFVSLFVNESFRKPFLVGKLADEIDLNLMTSLLSVESLYKTLLASGLAFLLGVFTDIYDLGTAFMGLSVLILLLYLIPVFMSKIRFTRP